MNNFYELNTLMPQKNCGHCGWPSCSALARRMTTGEAKATDCIYLDMPEYHENKTKIENLLKEGIKIGVRTPTNSEKVTFIRPCTTESGKVTATTRLIHPQIEEKELKYGFHDPSIFCSLLENYKAFEEIKCSEKMGIARIGFNGKSVLLFGNGQIKVRKAKDKGDIYATINLISRIMWGSMICKESGCDTIDCASGGCPEYSTTRCSALISPPVIEADTMKKRKPIKGLEIFDKLGNIDTKDIFMTGLKTIENAVKSLETTPSEKSVDIEKFKSEMTQNSLDYIVKTEKIEDAVLGIVLMGITRDITRALAAAMELKDNENTLAKEAKELAAEAYNAFRNSDLEKGKEIEERYQKILDKIAETKDKKPPIIEIEKIARNGRNIARILELTV